MESEISPIKSKTLISLPDVNVSKSLMKFKNVSLQSDKFVCVRADDHISIIDVKTKNVADLKTVVDSAIVNPSKNIIGLKSQSTLQVFDLTKKEKVNSAIFNGSVEFWQWVDEETIALVTADKVFHWDIPSKGKPCFVFDREPYEGRLQIINYRASVDKNWLILGGIAAVESGGIDGILQLYSNSRQRSQIFRGTHTGCFAHLTLDGRDAPCDLFCFTLKTGGGTKFSAVEIAAEKQKAFHCVSLLDFRSPGDFAVSIQADSAHGVVFLVTKLGFLFLADIHSGAQMFTTSISSSTVFASVLHAASGGIVTINQDGLLCLHSLDMENVVRYLASVKKDYALAVQTAMRLRLPADEQLFVDQFDAMLQEGNYIAAARLAEGAPNNLLRTKETILKFSRLSPKPGQAAPVLQYFSYLLKKGVLNEFESISLVEPILGANASTGTGHIEQWIRNEKLAFSEKLGDVLAPHDSKLACSVYLRTGCAKKAIDCFLVLGQFAKIVPYAKREHYRPDYKDLLQRLRKINAEHAKEFASKLLEEKEIEIEAVVEIFMRGEDFKATTSLLLDVFRARGDREEDAELQTLLLSINIQNAPQVAEAILDSEEYALTHYDHLKIAMLCENAELYSKALENYEALEDIKRCLRAGVNSRKLDKEFVLGFFGEMSPEEGVECLSDLLEDEQDNVGIVVEVAKRYSEQMTPKALVALFESARSPEAVYRYLGSIVNDSADAEVVFKYVEAAARTEQYKELRRVCQQNDVFEAERVKRFLVEADLDDPRPLIVVCDRFGYVEELTRYLYQKEMFAFIEAYVRKMNCKSTPKVVATLLDLDAPEEKICSLLDGIASEDLGDSFEALIIETSSRGRLLLLLPWLEQQSSSGSTLPALHNALATIYVNQNTSPEDFLENNPFYSKKDVGFYCEKRDPRLAFIVYRRGKSDCDEQLIRVAKTGGFYAELAQLLVERQDESLWAKALETNDDHRRALITQVVTALGRCREPEEVSVAVKAFIAAELPKELIELLERLVITAPPDRGFHGNRNLQNLLILTAIKADPLRVMNYLNRLSDYDGPDIAKIAGSEQYQLYEEAFEIYVKFGLIKDAAVVLIDRVSDLARAKAFAEKYESAEVWEMLGCAQLESALVADAIFSFLKSGSTTRYEKVIEQARSAERWSELAEYLQMVRKKVKTAAVDNELLYVLAKTNSFGEFKEILAEQNFAKIDDVGYRFMREEQYEPAKIIYEHTKNFSRLALCYINMCDFEQAVSSAEKANNIRTWKVVCYACVDADEFSLAQFCASRVIVNAEEIKELITHYEQHGYFEQVVDVFEKGIANDRPPSGLFTALGILYCKYKPEKLMPHLRAFSDKVNLQEMINVSLEYKKWPELTFMYKKNGQVDRAMDVMIEHSPSCFDPAEFKKIVANVSHNDSLLKAVDFYVSEHPLLLNDLLVEMKLKIDYLEVINKFRGPKLPLIFGYLLSIQHLNKPFINETINQLYIDEENVGGLLQSIQRFDGFSSLNLAKQLEEHPLRRFRSVSAMLYNKIKNFSKSLEILREDEMYDEMIKTVKEADNPEKAEELARYFVGIEKPSQLVACLFDCRKLIRPHFALEIGLDKRWSSFVMPFVVQTVGNFEKRLARLENLLEERSREQGAEEKKKKDKLAGTLGPGSLLAITSGRAKSGRVEGHHNGEINLFD